MSMKAVVIHEYGGPSKLSYEDVPIPVLGKREVLVKNHVTGVNFLDIILRKAGDPQELPKVLGFEAGGVIEKLGPGVTELNVGDKVTFTEIGIGSYAEYTKVAANRLVHVPDGISLEAACCLMVQGMTAHYLVHSIGNIKPGDSVLVHAAAGGTGALVCTLAKNAGAFVIGTCSTEAKAEVAKAAGADEIILYTQKDFVEETMRITEGKAVNVIYDNVGKDTLHKGLNCLAFQGTLVHYGSSSGQADPIDKTTLAKHSHTYIRPALANYVKKDQDLQMRSSDLFHWFAEGKVKLAKPVILPLADACKAHEIMENRGTMGKILLKTARQ